MTPESVKRALASDIGWAWQGDSEESLQVWLSEHLQMSEKWMSL
jgi:hypothetical protein